MERDSVAVSPSEKKAAARVERRRHLAASDGVRLAYWLTAGDLQPAPLIVFLHGAASNHTRWSELVTQTRLAERWDLLRPDLRGNGASIVRGRLEMEVWCRDLEEILDREERSSAVFVGHSLGAQIAIQFAARRPQRCSGLALVDPTFPNAAAGRRRRQIRLRSLVAVAALGVRGLNTLGLRRSRFPTRDLEELDHEARRILAKPGGQAELARRYTSVRPILRHMPTANYLQQIVATLSPLPALEAIDQPTLVLESGGSSFADPVATRVQIERFPNVERVTIDADHWPLTEKPTEVREAIESWIDRTWPPA